MKIFNKLNAQTDLSLALGFFDGIHLGHKAVIVTAIEYAKKNNLKSAVVTFRDAPSVVLNNKEPKYILTCAEKIKILEKMGIDYMYLLDFDENFAKISAMDYLTNLVENLHPKAITTGYNHFFGYNKSGGVDFLRLMQEKFNYKFFEVNQISLKDSVISSSEIKKELSFGNLQKANSMLGYRFFIRNEVIKGVQIGRSIGFKTANLKFPNCVIQLPNGVYAVEVEVLGNKYMGIANYGIKPTVTNVTNKLLEVHIIDFNENIYGEQLKVTFLSKIRDEKKFQSLLELKTQIAKDIECLEL